MTKQTTEQPRATTRQQVRRVNGKHVREARADEPKEAIVCTGSGRTLSLLNAALRCWELRNRVACLIVAGALTVATVARAGIEQGAVSLGRASVGKVADDESPCGPFVSDAVCEDKQTLSEEAFYKLFPDADEDDYANYRNEPREWLRADVVQAWIGEDVDGASARVEEKE